VDYEGGVQVEVALSAQVAELHNGNTIWANSAAEKGKVEGRNVSSVVAQMSKLTDRSIEELLKSTLPAAAYNSEAIITSHQWNTFLDKSLHFR